MLFFFFTQHYYYYYYFLVLSLCCVISSAACKWVWCEGLDPLLQWVGELWMKQWALLLFVSSTLSIFFCVLFSKLWTCGLKQSLDPAIALLQRKQSQVVVRSWFLSKVVNPRSFHFLAQQSFSWRISLTPFTQDPLWSLRCQDKPSMSSKSSSLKTLFYNPREGTRVVPHSLLTPPLWKCLRGRLEDTKLIIFQDGLTAIANYAQVGSLLLHHPLLIIIPMPNPLSL